MNVYCWPEHRLNLLFQSDDLEVCKAFICAQTPAMQPWHWVEDEGGNIVYERHLDLRRERAETVAEAPPPVIKKTPKLRKIKEVIVEKDQAHIDALSAAILDCKHAYYCLGEPLISDPEFDKLYDELTALDSGNKALGVGCILCGEKSDEKTN